MRGSSQYLLLELNISSFPDFMRHVMLNRYVDIIGLLHHSLVPLLKIMFQYLKNSIIVSVGSSLFSLEGRYC